MIDHRFGHEFANGTHLTSSTKTSSTETSSTESPLADAFVVQPLVRQSRDPRRASFGGCIRVLVLFVLACGVLAGGSFSETCRGDEEYEKFLSKLKDLGTQKKDPSYYQIAFDYLSYLESTDLVSLEIKQSLGYEKGTLLIESAKFVKSRNQRDRLLEQGKELLQQFIADNEFHPYAPAAKNELANLLIVTARQKISDDAGKGSELLKQATKDMVAAGQIVTETRETIKGLLENMPAKPTDPRLRKRRRELENEYLRARLMLPSMQEELSDIYPAGSDLWRQSLELAEKEFLDVSGDYRTRPQGQLAWIYRGRVLAKLGKPKEALAVYRETFEQADTPAFRELKRIALELAFPIWLDPKQTTNGFIEAVKVADPILATLTPQDERSSSWLKIRLELAKAYRQFYEYLRDKPEKTPEDKISETRALQKSTTLARFVAAANNEIKSEAQQLLVDWGARAKVDPVVETPPTNFVEARDRAGQVLAELEIVKKQIATLEEQLAGNPADRDELTTQLNAAKLKMIETPKRAIDYLQMAVSFTDDSTPIRDINKIRYQLCFCYYTLKDYFRAALIGEFLLERFPTISGSKESAAIAMYSYWDLYTAAPEEDNQFEKSKVDDICSRIVSQWPNAAEAAEATRMLIAIAVSSGNLQRAVELLNRVPAESVHRAPIELNTGQALWVNYFRQKSEAEEAGNYPQQAVALNKIRDQAEKLLTRGATSVTTDNLTRSKAKSLLSLAKIKAEKNDGPAVLALMEKPDVGLMNLVEADHPAVSDNRLQLDIYRIGLKGLVNSIAPNSNSASISAIMDKARRAMNRLKTITASMENGDKYLVSLYYDFANDIKSRMDSLVSISAKKNFSVGLSDFLKAAAETSTDFKVIMWAAGTLLRIGDSFTEAGATDEAKPLYDAALKIVDQIDAKKIEVSAADKLSVLRSRGKALLGAGQFEDAIDVFTRYLVVKPATLDVQIDAAMAFQKDGEDKGDTSLVVKAVMGGGEYKDPDTGRTKKAIWGWGKLSQAISSRPQFKKQFLEARLNLARSRFIYGQLKDSAKLYQLAQRDIDGTREKYPDLGGPRMKAQFEALEKEIQAKQ